MRRSFQDLKKIAENLDITYVETPLCALKLIDYLEIPPCNRFKDNILPELFMDKIAKIFMFQMDKQYGSKVCWRFTKTMLLKLLK